MDTTRVQGTITEEHADEIESVFGVEIANRVRNATTATTFLAILFNLDDNGGHD